MISVIDRDDEKQLMLNTCHNSAFGCKIAGIALAYGFDKRFSMFWTDALHRSVFCLVDNTMLIAGEIEDGDEALAFIKLSGAKEITCSLDNLKTLGIQACKSGEIICKQIEGRGAAWEAATGAPIREIYAILEEVGMLPDEEDAFEAFYLDLSHRIRHGIARVVLSKPTDKLIGCAVVSSVTGTSAILSAVAVREQHRGEGVGTQLVKHAEALLPGKTMYIYKDTGTNDNFYKRLGYSFNETWAQVNL